MARKRLRTSDGATVSRPRTGTALSASGNAGTHADQIRSWRRERRNTKVALRRGEML